MTTTRSTARTTAVAAVAALLVSLPGIASAALPAAGATYAGSTSDGDGTITLVARTAHLLKTVKVVDSCGYTTTFKHVKVKPSGKFHAVVKHPDYDVVISELTGTFDTRTSASGTFSEVACTGSRATFDASQQ
ncbi:MAG: hypothetical protein ACXVEC_08945 [Nocardioides sp.]